MIFSLWLNLRWGDVDDRGDLSRGSVPLVDSDSDAAGINCRSLHRHSRALQKRLLHQEGSEFDQTR